MVAQQKERDPVVYIENNKRPLPPLVIPGDLLTEIGWAVDGNSRPTSCLEKYVGRFEDPKTQTAIREEVEEMINRSNRTITIDSSNLVPMVTMGSTGDLVHNVDRMVITSYARYSLGGRYIEDLSTEAKEPDPHVVTYAMVDPRTDMPISTFRAKLPNELSYRGQDDIHKLFHISDSRWSSLNGGYRELSRWSLGNIFPVIDQVGTNSSELVEIRTLARAHKAQAFRSVFEHLYRNTQNAPENNHFIPAVCIFSDAVYKYTQNEQILEAEPISVTEEDSELRRQLERMFPNYWTVNQVQQKQPGLYRVTPIAE